MRRLIGVGLALVLTAAGCASFRGARTGPQERIVRVDFSHDEFASHYWRYFPSAIDARPGDTVVFKQEWTGEPHTVTFGRLVDATLLKLDALFARFGEAELTPEEETRAEREYAEVTRDLPILDPYAGASAQNAGQPCYLDEGGPPLDPRKACEPVPQPDFDGRQSFYSSGFIPPEGPEGNEYRVRLADDIAPGRYRYYCVIHFPEMSGELVVKPKGSELTSRADVNRRALEEIEALAGPLRRSHGAAADGRARYETIPLEPPLGGYHAGDEYTVAIDEFLPRTYEARVGETVTWTIVGAHTVSFDVPRYLPMYVFEEDGTLRRNSRVDEPAGGSPDPGPVDFTRGPLEIDGGRWDGEGFVSSGLLGSEPFSRYSLTFTRVGRYRYACLVHPTMVGTVIVRPPAPG